ncbi:MAG: hypothetical protein R3B45_15375 [Bdellovibrionota bacterium]
MDKKIRGWRMKKVEWEQDSRGRKLDHVYYRGATVHKSLLDEQTNSFDHPLLTIEISYDKTDDLKQ